MALQILFFVPYNLLQPAASFSAISQKLLVSPVLKKLVFLNSPEEVSLDNGTFHSHCIDRTHGPIASCLAGYATK